MLTEQEKREVNRQKQKKYRELDSTKARSKVRYQNLSEEQRQRKRDYQNLRYQNNRERIRASQSAYLKADPTRIRRNNLKALYRITLEEYENLLASQNGVCALCGLPPEPDTNLSIDHDHSCCSGKKSCGKCIRSLLHPRCNLIIGLLHESLSLAIKVNEYIKRFQVGTL
jgi:hypothetical protein